MAQNARSIVHGEGQRKYYSGKKKCHTVKNNIVTEQETGRVIILSDTVEGSKSDKKLADEQELKFPPWSQLWQDKGYQGYAPHQPKKSPKKNELGEEEKETSRQISKERIGVEHSIGVVKIFRIVRDNVFLTWIWHTNSRSNLTTNAIVTIILLKGTLTEIIIRVNMASLPINPPGRVNSIDGIMTGITPAVLCLGVVH